MTNKIVALDVDGVLVDYVGAACAWCGKTKDEATAWDFFSAWGMPGLWNAWDRVVAQPGFCEGLELLHGSTSFVTRLRCAGYRVIFATSPHKNAPLWPGERQLVLEDYFHARREDVVMLHDKRLVRADILVDDKPENIADFNGPGILFSQPWNESYHSHGAIRVTGYEQAIEAVKGILG